jgi:HAE1 family hydrophobic/amphiphilic exporter-1
MTSFSTIAAAIPPALALGPGAETRIPMAITIIGGVAISTILTLYVVPSVYLLFSKIEHKHYEPILGVDHTAEDILPAKDNT